MQNTSLDILLVEDCRDDAESFECALKETASGTRLRIVADGEEALALIFGKNASFHGTPVAMPRLLVLDLRLPRVNGMEVLQRLKANRLTRNIPIVLLSSSAARRDLAAAYELGVNSYLVKPTDFDEFALMVRALVQYWLQFNQPLKL